MKTGFLAGLMLGLAPLFVGSSAFAFNTVNLHLSNSSNVSVYIDDSEQFTALLDSFNSYQGGNVQVTNDVDISIGNQKGKKGAAPGDNTITINGKNIRDVSAVINDSSQTEVYVDSFNSTSGDSVDVTNDVDVSIGGQKGKPGLPKVNSGTTVKGKDLQDVSGVIDDTSRTETYLDSANSYRGDSVEVTNDVDITAGKKKAKDQAGNGIAIKGKEMQDVSALIDDSSRTETYVDSFDSYNGGSVDVSNDVDINTGKKGGGLLPLTEVNAIAIKGHDLQDVSTTIADSSRTEMYVDSFNGYNGDAVNVTNDVDISAAKQKGKVQTGNGIEVKGHHLQDMSAVINDSSTTEIYVDSFNGYNGGSVNVTNDVDISAGKKSSGQRGFLGSNSVQIRGKNMEDVSATINDSSSTAVYLDSFNSTDGTTVDVSNDIDITTGKKKGDKQPNARGNAVGISGKNLHDVVLVISGNSVIQMDVDTFNSFMASGNLEVTNEITVP